MPKSWSMWTSEEESILEREWEAALRPCGQARRGFLQHVATLLPRHPISGIKRHMRKFVNDGRMPRQIQRRTYQPRTLTDTEAAYLAAMLDGEGSVRKVYDYGGRRGWHGERIRDIVQVVLCYNTDFGILRKVQTLVPMARISHHWTSTKSTKMCGMVVLSGYQPLKDVLTAILPYMAHTEKIRRVHAVLNHIEERLANGRLSEKIAC